MSSSTSSTLDEIRPIIAGQPLRPYEVLFGHERPVRKTVKTAKRIMVEGWADRNLVPVHIEAPFDWDAGGHDHRSWRFHLHCWDMLGPILAAYEVTSEEHYLRFAAEIVLDWAKQHTTIDYDRGFAWYDMAIGVRAYRLAYIVDAASRLDSFTDQEIGVFLGSVELHRRALADDRNFAAHSNHGFYLAAGQLAMARRLNMLPKMDRDFEQATWRIQKLIETQFAADGVHREHSPDYHRMVGETFDGLIKAGLLDRPEFREKSHRIQEAMAWFVLPNGRIAMFGDTPGRHMIRDEKKYGEIEDDTLRFVTSGGKDGSPPSESMRVFPESGYAVVRSGWPRGAEDFDQHSYLAQIAAFHSRTHKHADDLSIIWYDRNSEILVDAGRFGYLNPTKADSALGRQGFYYSHPNRVYVESTRAHNTVEIDHQSYPRRRVKPYGSAIERTGEQDGVAFIESEVRHRKSIRHARQLLFHPGRWLVVFDWLLDNRKKNHDFTQWFQLAPELDVVRESALLRITLPDEDESLFAVPLLEGELGDPIRGQTEPELQGWISRRDNELTPAWSIPVRQSGVSGAQFAMLFVFGKQPPRIMKANTNISGRRARFTWQQDRVKHDVRIHRPQEGDVSVNYERIERPPPQPKPAPTDMPPNGN